MLFAIMRYYSLQMRSEVFDYVIPVIFCPPVVTLFDTLVRKDLRESEIPCRFGAPIIIYAKVFLSWSIVLCMSIVFYGLLRRRYTDTSCFGSEECAMCASVE